MAVRLKSAVPCGYRILLYWAELACKKPMLFLRPCKVTSPESSICRTYLVGSNIEHSFILRFLNFRRSIGARNHHEDTVLLETRNSPTSNKKILQSLESLRKTTATKIEYKQVVLSIAGAVAFARVVQKESIG